MCTLCVSAVSVHIANTLCYEHNLYLTGIIGSDCQRSSLDPSTDGDRPTDGRRTCSRTSSSTGTGTGAESDSDSDESDDEEDLKA